MKIKSMAVMAAVSAIFYGTNATAGALFDLYAGATIGAGGATLFADGNDHTNSAQSYGAVIGLDIPVFRFELEYNYMNSDNTKMHLGMINAYAKMPSTVIHPYIGVGVGSVFSGDSDAIDIDTVAAYQGMLGVTFDIPVLPLKIDAEGRALYAPNIYDVSNVKPDILQYELRLKLRYIF